ncbi:MAG: class I SAM-dependent methyltransferase [Mesorhizobium sp.]
MASEAAQTLFHPFHTGDIDLPSNGVRALFIGAEAGMRLPPGFAAELTLVNGFRPAFLDLKRSGHAVLPEPEGQGYGRVLALAGRHRGENEARLAQAILRCADDGVVAMAGGNTDGISSLRKRLAAAGVPVSGHLSKYHGEVFWLSPSAEARDHAALLIAAQTEAELVDGRFRTAPGMFSHDRIDAGSRLLATHLPDDLKGAAADFCAGWGYLSVELAQRSPSIASIDLFEADHASLEVAKVNMAANAPAVTTAFHWLDLAGETVPRKFDIIVMNPPFHQGRAADPGIGQALIRAASAALVPDGRLFLVANRGLPYEQVLVASFRRSGELARDAAFKVLWARR